MSASEREITTSWCMGRIPYGTGAAPIVANIGGALRTAITAAPEKCRFLGSYYALLL